MKKLCAKYFRWQSVNLIISVCSEKVYICTYYFLSINFILIKPAALHVYYIIYRFPLRRGVLDTPLCDKICQNIIKQNNVIITKPIKLLIRLSVFKNFFVLVEASVITA
jgi:hypothetical protein